MTLSISYLRLLRILPAITSTATLQFALDEHLMFGTWMDPFVRKCANAHLPAWWTRGGLRWRWILILGYPMIYILAVLNLFTAADQLKATSSTKWYVFGLMFSMGHMGFVKMALKRIADIENDVPKGNITYSMGQWLRMNWIRALFTDLPALLCFITAALKAL